MKPAKIVAVSLFLLIVALGIAEQIYVHKIFDDFSKRAAILETDIEARNFSSAATYAEELEEWWEKKASLLESLAHNRDIKSICQEAARLHGYIQAENYTESKVSLAALKCIGDTLSKLLTFRLEHII